MASSSSLPVLSFGNLSLDHQQQPIPSFAQHVPADPDPLDTAAPSFAHVARAVLKAKRITIVCGKSTSSNPIPSWVVRL